MLLNKVFLNKVLIILVCVVCILVFLVPQGYGYKPVNDTAANETREASYITDDLFTLIVYVPFPVLWITFLLVKKNLVKRILKFLLLEISLLYIILSLQAAVFIAQDFKPSYGAFIPILIFPLLVGYFINDGSLKKSVP